MDVAHPLNVPICINGYFGDSVLRTGQGPSTITKKLAQNLQLRIHPTTRNMGMVFPKITIGTYNYEVQHPMFIYEDYVRVNPNCGPFYVVEEGQAWSPYEIILGVDFIVKMDIILHSAGKSVAMSDLFGSVPRGSMRPFVKQYAEGDTYASVQDDRVILLFDLDCFEVQVHEKPHQKGKPRVVVNSSNRILAVSYEAKRLGINRDSTPYLPQAKQLCPGLIAIYVPTRRNTTGGPPRPDTSIARDATGRIVTAINTALAQFGGKTIFEYSSNDEFYVDLTDLVNSYQNGLANQIGQLWGSTFLYNGTCVGNPIPDYTFRRVTELKRKRSLTNLELKELRLIFGSAIGNLIVGQILQDTTYQSSVGIGCNKLMAKIASGTHKPGSITIVAPSGFNNFSKLVQLKDIPGLGGKIGQRIRQLLPVNPTMWDIRSLPVTELANCRVSDDGRLLGLEKATGILLSANGVCNKQVVAAYCHRSSGISRNLHGKRFTRRQIHDILLELAGEFLEKMNYEERVNSRNPKNVKLNIRLQTESDNFNSNVEINGDISGADSLLQALLSFCNPSLNSWNPSQNEVDSIQFTANF